jgi:hypothetical protein
VISSGGFSGADLSFSSKYRCEEEKKVPRRKWKNHLGRSGKWFREKIESSRVSRQMNTKWASEDDEQKGEESGKLPLQDAAMKKWDFDLMSSFFEKRRNGVLKKSLVGGLGRR